MKKITFFLFFCCFLVCFSAAESDDHIENTGYTDWMHQVPGTTQEDNSEQEDDPPSSEDNSSSSDGNISSNSGATIGQKITEKLQNFVTDTILFIDSFNIFKKPDVQSGNIKNTKGKTDALVSADSNRIRNEKAVISQKANDSNQKQDKETALAQSTVIGDPVYVASGQYSDSQTDYRIRYLVKSFEITRTYTTKTGPSGSLGKNWLSSLDSRLVFGISSVTEQDCSAFYNDAVAGKRNAINQLISEYTALFGKQSGSWNTIADELEYNRNHLNGLIPGMQAVHEEGFSNAILSSNSQIHSFLSRLENSIYTIQAQDQEYADLIRECRGVEQAIRDALAVISEHEQFYNELNQTVALGNEITQQNSDALFDGTPDYYRTTGLDTITLVDAAGNVHAFKNTSSAAAKGAVQAPAGTVWTAQAQSSYSAITKTGNAFTLTLRDGSSQTFTSEGLLSRITDAYGNWISFIRNESGKLSSITTSTGKEHKVLWSGNCISCIQPADDSSRGVSFSYADERLTAVTDEDGDTVRYTWRDGLLSAMIKPDGSSITFAYDAVNASGKPLVTATTNEEGFTEFFDYDFIRNTTEHTDHSGVQTLYRFDDSYNIIMTVNADGSVTASEYGDGVHLTSETRNGKTTRFEYNSSGQKTRARYQDGTYETWEYDSAGNVVSHSDTSGVTYSYARNCAGDITEERENGTVRFSRTYTPEGLVSSETIYADRPVTAFFEYDTEGNMIRSVTGGKTEEWTWNANGQPLSYRVNGMLINRAEYTARTTKITSFSGLETTYFTNERKDTIRIEERDTRTDELRVTRIEYDKRHLFTALWKGDGQNCILAGRYRYDGEGRSEAAISYRNGDAVILLYDFSDESGSMQSKPCAVTLFCISQETVDQYALDSADGFSRADLAALARLSSDSVSLSFSAQPASLSGSQQTETQSNDMAAVRHYNDEGLLSMIETEAGKEWYQYDAYGNLTGVLSGGNGSQTDADYYATWCYDADQRSYTMTEGGWYSTTYTLNAWGEPVAVTDGNGNTMLLRYDFSGNVASVTDPYGNVTAYEYDPSGALITTRHPDGSIFHHDCLPLSARSEQNAVSVEMSPHSELQYDFTGNVTEAFDGTTHLVFLYDKGSRLIRQRNLTTGEDISFEYDRAGNRTRMTDGTASVIYGYGRNNELTSVTAYTGNELSASVTFTYDCRGRETRRTYRNGVMQTTGYNDEGNTELVVQYDPNGALLWGEGFLYDEEGRIAASVTSDAFLTLSFYDEEGRLSCVLESDTETTERRELEEALEYGLSSASSSPGEAYYLPPDTYYALKSLLDMMQPSRGNALTVLQAVRRTEYAYDEAGNRIEKRTAAGTLCYEYDGESRLTRAGNHAYAYDAHGNLLSDTSALTSVTYGYSEDDRMITSTYCDFLTGSRQMNVYGYDPFGRRISLNVFEEAENGDYMLTGSEKLEYDGFLFNFRQISSTFQ